MPGALDDSLHYLFFHTLTPFKLEKAPAHARTACTSWREGKIGWNWVLRQSINRPAFDLAELTDRKAQQRGVFST